MSADIIGGVRVKALLERAARLQKELADFIVRKNTKIDELLVALRGVRTSVVLKHNLPEQEVLMLESLVDGVLQSKKPTLIGDAAARELMKRMGS